MHLVLSVHMKGVLWYVFALAKICATDTLVYIYLH